MELANEFEVPLPIEDAWRVLTDLERVAPCMPGAQLQEVEGSEYRGLVRVKVGPITVDYKGTATFEQLDEAAHRAVLRASGRETRGQGNATATVEAVLDGRGATTHVAITTDLDITGRVAQFGRGALVDVSSRLLDQFAVNLAADLIANGTGHAGSATVEPDESPAPVDAGAPAALDGAGSASPQAGGDGAVRQIDSQPPAPVKLTSLLGGPVLRRLAPVAALVAAVAMLLRRRSRRG